MSYQYIRINFSDEDHLGHFQRVVVSDATAFDDCLLDAEFFRQFAQLFPAAMNDADSNADLLKQSQFFAQRDQSIAIFRDFAREFHDERFPFEALNIRQRFTQEVETQLASNFAGVGHSLFFHSIIGSLNQW